MKEGTARIENKDNYAYVTRNVIDLFNEGRLTHVDRVDVEPRYGYVTRLTYDDGSYRVTHGNDLGLNLGAAEDLAKDKGHTKFMLRTIGINTPKGEEFLLPAWAERIRESQAKRGKTDITTTNDAREYLEHDLGYPAYIKAVSGSQGSGVERADTWEDAQATFLKLDAEKVRVAIVEEAIDMPDYRLVVLDGELISSYRRVPLGVTGDGQGTIAQLLQRTQELYDAQGRDTKLKLDDERIVRHIGHIGLTLDSVIEDGRHVTLLSISNLSAGGTSVDLTEQTHERWRELAGYVAENMNLRIAGVDLACADITSATSDYSVLEVNAAPGLDHYASSGDAQKTIVKDLYAKVLNAYPSSPGHSSP